ncbi:MAG TPA: ribonuclease P protein component [Bacillales bacterium]|nr:ribonuclease P protein component [Bacillales bacterium]
MQSKRRLKKNIEFQRVFRKGTSFANRQFVVYYTERSGMPFRIGISVSKRVGNAVTRNRIKRIVREVIREVEDDLSEEKDYVIIARKPTANMNYQQMKSSMIHVLKRSGLLRKGNERRKRG